MDNHFSKNILKDVKDVNIKNHITDDNKSRPFLQSIPNDDKKLIDDNHKKLIVKNDGELKDFEYAESSDINEKQLINNKVEEKIKHDYKKINEIKSDKIIKKRKLSEDNKDIIIKKIKQEKEDTEIKENKQEKMNENIKKIKQEKQDTEIKENKQEKMNENIKKIKENKQEKINENIKKDDADIDKNDDDDDNNKEIVTVSKKNIKDINLTKLSELKKNSPISKITVKVHFVYSSNENNFYFTIEGKEKSIYILCVAYIFHGKILRNKIQSGTYIEIQNAFVKYIDPKNKILCEESIFEIILNKVYKTKVKILTVNSNDTHEQSQPQCYLKTKQVDEIFDKPIIEKKKIPRNLSAEFQFKLASKILESTVETVTIKKEDLMCNLKIEPKFKLDCKTVQSIVDSFFVNSKNSTSFTSFSDIAQNKFDSSKTINIIGKVVYYDKCDKIFSRGNEQSLRKIKLVDISNNDLEASLWNKKGEHFTPHLDSIVLILNTTVRYYGQKNRLNVYDNAIVKIFEGSQ